MAYWRMKLRDGKGGEDMWDECRRKGLAAIQYDPIQQVDLRGFTPEHHPEEWKQLRGSQPGSMACFAWEIRDGDTVYVGDSKKRQVVGMGYATAEIGKPAYRFDAQSPISSRGRGVVWPHLIDMDWDGPFEPFDYKDPRPQTTVLRLEQDKITEFDRFLRRKDHAEHGVSEKKENGAYLPEESYPRYTPAASRMIARKHQALSNRFRDWMDRAHNIHVRQEREHIDAVFEAGGRTFLAEFKVAYHGDTRRAIREALGQILEYNHYPPRISHDHSLLILDATPRKDDMAFLRCLTEKFSLPLSLGWESNFVFEFFPPLTL